jgi:hypothetical protein
MNPMRFPSWAGIIKREFPFAAIAVLISGMGLSLGQEIASGEEEKIAFPEWVFCVVYQVRDARDSDARPANPPNPDPFGKADSYVPHTLLSEDDIIDSAALSVRVVKSSVLKRDVSDKAIHCALRGEKHHPVMDCYEPHHIFVFYSNGGKPVAAIEACFTCNRVKTSPMNRVVGGGLETADLAGLAKIASDAGLDLKPYDSLGTYIERLEKLEGEAQKSEAQMPDTIDTLPEP